MTGLSPKGVQGDIKHTLSDNCPPYLTVKKLNSSEGEPSLMMNDGLAARRMQLPIFKLTVYIVL